MTNEQRQKIEREIVGKIIDVAHSRGYAISINNGGDDNEISKSRDKDSILENMFGTDEETMFFHVWIATTGEIKDDTEFWVEFVYGNDGYDVIHNYVVNEDSKAVLPDVEKFIQELEKRDGRD